MTALPRVEAYQPMTIAQPRRRVRPAAIVGPARWTLTIGSTAYAVRRLGAAPEIARRAFRLAKGDGTLYDVAETPFGPACDCPDFLFRRDGVDPEGCKHVRALVAVGLIEPIESVEAGIAR